MTALPILHQARRHDISITLQGDKLKLASSAQPPIHIIEAIRQHRSDIIEHLKRLDVRSPPPRCWIDGVARLTEMRTPAKFPAANWNKVVGDAALFLETWAAKADSLGWHVWEVFGCHRRAPWHRIQGLGLVPLLQGQTIVALTSTEAAVRTRTGAMQTFRRKQADPLYPAERCLIWELDHE